MKPIGLAFDIETAIDPHAALPEATIKPGNTKDPGKLAIKQDEANEALIRKAALDPHFSRVVAIGYLLKPDSDDDTEQHYVDVINTPDDYLFGLDGDAADHKEDLDKRELALIIDLWATITRTIDTDRRFATFNGTGFDLKFLYRRSLILGLPVPERVMDRTYHVDALLALTESEPGTGRGIMFQAPTPTPRNLRFYSATLLNPDPHAGLVDIDKSQNATAIGIPERRQELVDDTNAATLATYLLANKCVTILGTA